MKKKLCIVMIIAFILSLNSIPIYAETNSESYFTFDEDNYISIPYLDGIGNVIPGEKIYIGGVENELYCTFEDPNQAIKDLKNSIPKYLDYLMTTYNLKDLQDDNWKDYQTIIEVDRATNTLYSSNSLDYMILRNFLGIYEDYDRNEEILKCKTLDELKILLPYYSTTAKEFIEERVELSTKLSSLSKEVSSYSMTPNTGVTLRASTGLNVYNALVYADTYAVAPNTGYPFYIGGDCTNFVSQILFAGGIAMQIPSGVNPSIYSGWWCLNGTSSVSWRNADTFARYMGVGLTTNSVYTFSANIVLGDIVACDFERNGTWNHMGFVSGTNIYVSAGYYNFKIAQHTNNYNAWATSSTNGWDVMGGTYGRVRR